MFHIFFKTKMREIIFMKLCLQNETNLHLNQYNRCSWLSMSKVIYDEEKLAPEPDIAFLNLYSYLDRVRMNHLLELDVHSNLTAVNVPLLAPGRISFYKFSKAFRKIYNSIHFGFLSAFGRKKNAFPDHPHDFNSDLYGYDFNILSQIQIQQIKTFIRLLQEIPDPDDPNFVYKFYTRTTIGNFYLNQISKFKFVRVVFDRDLIRFTRRDFNKRKYLNEIVNYLDRSSEYVIPVVIKTLIKLYHGEWLPVVKFYCFHCEYCRYHEYQYQTDLLFAMAFFN